MYLRAKRGLSVVQESLKVQLKTGINALEEFVEVCSISKEEQRKSFPVSVPSITSPKVSRKLYAVGVYECSEMSWVEGSG